MMAKNQGFRDNFKIIVSGKVLFDEPMERHTSIGVGGKADILVFPKSKEDLRNVISHLRQCRIPFIPVGNCTNLIVKDGGFRGAVISMKHLNGVRLMERNGDRVLINAEAGVPLSEIVILSVGESLTGMEFCAGIPGSVGGAVKMNAGAYGREIKDTIETVELMDDGGEIRQFRRNGLKFDYRNLDIPEGTTIIGASFLLTRGITVAIQTRIAEILDIRKSKHPLEYRNAGSIFKNPKGANPAGQIIDAVGLKGTQIGNAKISEKHGNFIVNLGRAKAKDIIALIDTIKTRVREERGIDLETEVKIIGED